MIYSQLLGRGAKIILALICILSFALMLNASLHESTIVDELAHIPAGYAYVHFLDYRLNPEHPPALKALASIPLHFMNLQFPLTNPAWTTDVNSQWAVGGAFLFGLGNDANAVLWWARLFPILLTIGLILFVYFWSRRLFGPFWALLPAALTGFSPTILAHGHYVTTDIAAAFGALAGLYTFSNYTRNPSGRNLLIAGLGFGLAQVMKFSMILLIPVYLILIFVFWVVTIFRDWNTVAAGTRLRHFLLSGLRFLGQVIAIFALGTILVIYPVYAVFTANYPIARQTSDTVSILASFAGGPAQAGHFCSPLRCLADLDIWATKNAFTRPLAHFVLGVLMVIQRSSGGNTAYFLGEVSAQGSRLYFPLVYALKETIPALIIIFFAFAYALVRMVRAIARKQWTLYRYILDSFPQFSMIIFASFYWLWSMKSPLNIGVRHLMPTIPLFYILSAGALKKWFMGPAQDLASFVTTHLLDPRAARNILMKSALIGGLLLWVITESAIAAPHLLSYFNEFGGGYENGYKYVTDSNYDWGQDMFRLQEWIKAHPEVDKLALDFFGGSNTAYYLGDRAVSWNSSMGDPSAQGIHWFAISINNLEDSIQPVAPGFTRNPADEYSWLLRVHPKEPGMGGVPKPDYRVGTTVFIYKM